MFNTLCSGLFVVCLSIVSGCVSGNINEPDVCDSYIMGIVPANPSSVSLPALTYSIPINISNDIDKLIGISDAVNITIQSLVVNSTGNMKALKKVSVSISGTTPDTPEATFAIYNSNGTDPGNAISVDVLMDSATSFAYLSGPVTLTFNVYVQGSSPEMMLTSSLCVDVNGRFKKSL